MFAISSSQRNHSTKQFELISSKPSNLKPPVIIVGAARSGTNMLRDLLNKLPEFVTWPCDEINYIWRHGNRDVPHEEFTREMATDSVKKFVRNAVVRLNQTVPDAVVIEKTCATTLRCGFVHEVFPDSKFVHIYRDGRDVAASAALRWNAKLDLAYLLKKARYVPKQDLFYYASRYLGTRIYRLRTGKKRLSTWGPKFDGMNEVFKQHDLPTGCAIQLMKCVQSANMQLAELDPQQVYTVSYEDFTANPVEELSQLCTFLNVDTDESTLESITKNVSTKSVGKWKSQLTGEQANSIHDVAGGFLEELGYQIDPFAEELSSGI